MKRSTKPDPITTRAMAEGRRHCQCCGGMVMSRTGVVAHHGYKRPAGWYSQTASCMGARRLPLEASRDALGEMIDAMAAHLLRLQNRRAAVEAETVVLPFKYSRRARVDSFRTERVEHSVDVTRATFDEVQPAYEYEMRQGYVRTFDDLKARTLSGLDQSIKTTQEHLAEQRARWAAWWPLEAWVGDGWAPVSADSGHFRADGVTS